MSLSGCLPQSVAGQLSCTFSKTATILFSLRRSKRLLPMATEQCLLPVTCKDVLSALRARPDMFVSMGKGTVLFAVLNKARLQNIVSSFLSVKISSRFIFLV